MATDTTWFFGDFDFVPANGVHAGPITEMHISERDLTILRTALTRGERVLSGITQAKQVTIDGILDADNAEDLTTKARAMAKGLMNLPDILGANKPDGVYVYDDALLLNPETLFGKRSGENNSFMPFHAVFLCPTGFPRITTQTIQTTSNIDTVPYLGSIDVGGDTEPEPEIVINLVDASTIEDIYFSNITTNMQISITGETFIDGDSITLDISRKTVLHNTTPIPFNGVFPRFVPGVNEYQLTVAAGPETEALIQDSYNSEITVYGNNRVGQSFEVAGAETVSQIGLLLKKVSTPATAVVEVLVVGGGGGGGGHNGATVVQGGGGGAGQLVHKTGKAVAAGSYTVTVGAGGNGGVSGTPLGQNGGDSAFDDITALGGGGGGTTTGNGQNGGSGGGGGSTGTGHTTAGTGSSGTDTFGNNGGQGGSGDAGGSQGGGGGGGAGGAGGSNTTGGGHGRGGIGKDMSADFGTAYGVSGKFAGGGGGGNTDNSVTNYGGGLGRNGGSPSTAGAANTGGGGGGDNNSTDGKAGGSGIVIVKYLTADFGTCTGGTIVTMGSYTLHVFTSSGTFVADPLVSAELGNLLVKIETDATGEPSGTPVTDAELTITPDEVGDTFGELIKSLDDPALSATTTYHVTIYQESDGGDVNNYYVLKKQNTDVYADGNLETSADAGANWTQETGQDLYLKIWGSLPADFNLQLLIKYFASFFNVV